MRRLNQLSKFSRIFDWISWIFDWLASNWNMSHLIDLDVAFYMHLIWQFDLAHVKYDVWTGPWSLHVIERRSKVEKISEHWILFSFAWINKERRISCAIKWSTWFRLDFRFLTTVGHSFDKLPWNVQKTCTALSLYFWVSLTVQTWQLKGKP